MESHADVPQPVSHPALGNDSAVPITGATTNSLTALALAIRGVDNAEKEERRKERKEEKERKEKKDKIDSIKVPYYTRHTGTTFVNGLKTQIAMT